MSPQAQLTLLIDLAQTEPEKAVMADVIAGYPDALVVAAYDREGRTSVNVNACLVLDRFLASQAALAEQFDAYFDREKACNPAHAQLIDGMRCQLFDHNLHELHKWTYTLAELLDGYDPSQVTVLLPAAPTSSGIVLFEGEGEVSTNRLGRILYRRTDFLLHYVDAFMKARGVARGTRYKRPGRDWVGPGGRRLLRSYGLLALKGCKHLLHRLRHRKAAGLADSESTRVLAMTRSVVHSDYIAGLVRSGAAAPFVMDSAFHYPKTREESAKLFGGPSAHLYDHVSIGTMLGQLVRSFRDLVRLDLGIMPRPKLSPFEFDGLQVSLQTCLREAVTARFDYEILVRGVADYLTAHPRTSILLHCEMFTSYAPFLAKLCAERNVKCFQLAFGTYDMRPVAECVFGDGFLCFSEQQQESLRKVKRNDPRITYKGNLYISAPADAGSAATEIERRLAARHIVYYTQPYKESVEDEIVEWLSGYCMDNGYRLTVVLHPRGRIGAPIPSGALCQVIENSDYLAKREQLLSEATLAVTRTSNVGYLLLLRGVPLANILISPEDRLITQEYFDGYPLVLHSTEQLAAALSGIERKLGEFYSFREDFVVRSYRGMGVQKFSDFLSEESR